MKLLIATQTLDSTDPHLGFFHGWVLEFAKQCSEVLVVCLEEGTHTLPSNVTVFSLGKEKGKVSSWVYAWRLLKIACARRKEYDAVFVHMNPEYLVVCGALWKVWGKKVALWYAHKSVTLRLKVGLMFADVVFSVTKHSFPIATRKLVATGHGIDTSMFLPFERSMSARLRLITAGRIAESKHVKEMLPVVEELKRRGVDATLTIVGEAGTADEKKYKQELIEMIAERKLSESVRLYGPAAHATLPSLFSEHDVFLNFGSTGNMDKAGFEPLACGLPLVTTNEAFKEALTPFGLYAERENVGLIVDTILKAKETPTLPLISYVQENHSLQNLIPKIVSALS